MGGILPVKKDWIAYKGIGDVRSGFVEVLRARKGNITSSSETHIECDFGSLLDSPIIGKEWVLKSTLPMKAKIELESVAVDETRIRLILRDRHSFGFKWTIRRNYHAALIETVETIFALCKKQGI